MLKKPLWTEAQSQYLLAGFLLLLLPLLAALQYRWLGQLSESEQKQMQTGLRAAAVRFGEDFDQEITSVYAAFRLDFSAPEAAENERLAAVYARWQTAARHPQLVKTVYHVATDAAPQLLLLRLQPATRQLEARAWPAELTELRDRIKAQLQRLSKMTSLPPGAAPPAALQQSFQQLLLLEPNLPALLIPQPALLKSPHRQEFPLRFALDFTIVQLDREYLAHTLLPALTTRHFGDNTAGNYVLAISGGAPARTIFPAPAPDMVHADVSVDFFRLQTAEIRERFRRRLQSAAPADFGAGPHVRSQRARALRASPFRPLMAALAPAEAAGLWQLRVRHTSGSLAVAVAQARLDETTQPAQAVLSVHDRGLGVPAQDLPHLFEPFYRGSAAKAAQIHGNGLGLSIVQNIVQAHGGVLSVESRAGAGSTFSIRLPLASVVATEAEARLTAQLEEANLSNSQRILHPEPPSWAVLDGAEFESLSAADKLNDSRYNTKR